MGETALVAEQLSRDSLFQARVRTDFIPSAAWILAPVASFTLWVTIALLPVAVPTTNTSFPSFLLPTLVLLGLLMSALTGYLVYILVDRRNNHLGRTEAIYGSTLESVRAKTPPEDLKTLLPLSSAEHNFSRLVQQSGERSAVLWGLMATLPYVGWLALIYVLWFLSHDMEKHETREELILQDLERSIVATGGPGMPRREIRSPFGNAAAYAVLSLTLLVIASFGAIAAWRSLILMAVLSPTPTPSLDSLLILTTSMVSLGVVLNGWLYQTTRGPISHFAHHQQLEATLLKLELIGTSQPGGSF